MLVLKRIFIEIQTYQCHAYVDWFQLRCCGIYHPRDFKTGCNWNRNGYCWNAPQILVVKCLIMCACDELACVCACVCVCVCVPAYVRACRRHKWMRNTESNLCLPENTSNLDAMLVNAMSIRSPFYKCRRYVTAMPILYIFQKHCRRWQYTFGTFVW